MPQTVKRLSPAGIKLIAYAVITAAAGAFCALFFSGAWLD